MKRVALQSVVALATLAALAALWQLRHATILLLLSLGLAAAWEPTIAALVRRRWPRGVAIGLVYALGFGVVLGVLGVAGAAMPGELAHAAAKLLRLYGDSRAHWRSQGVIARVLAEHLPAAAPVVDDQALESIGLGALEWTGRGLILGADAAAVLGLSLLWTAAQQPLERMGLSLFPAAQRARTRHLWQGMRDGVGVQLRNDLVQSLAVGMCAAMALVAMGAPYAITGAIGIATLGLIPLIGPVLALLLAVLCGASVGPLWGGVAAAGTLALFAWLPGSLGGRLGSGRPHHPILAAIVLLLLWDLGGGYALFAAGPVTAALAALAQWRLDETVSRDPGRPSWQSLAERLDELDGLMGRTATAPELASVVGRLTALVAEAAATDDN